MIKCRKTFPSMSLVVALSAAMAACGNSEEDRATQRDVYSGYNGQKRCLDDWSSSNANHPENCKTMTDAEAQEMGLRPNYGSHFVYLWGPHYYWGSSGGSYGRMAVYPGGGGSQFYGAPMIARSSATATRAWGSMGITSTRGGFGATGHSFSGAVGA